MTQDEFLSSIKSNWAVFSHASDDGAITLASTGLQQIRAAMLPMFIINLYKEVGGIILGSGYIFGPTDMNVTHKFPVPSIFKINNELAVLPQMRGKTVFGRNDLFWFAFDAFGVCFMLDNLNLKTLRTYDDPYRAMIDCLIVGKL